MNHSRHHTTARLGRWLPADPKHLNDWLMKAIEFAEQKKSPFHPVVEEFRAMIENDPEMYMYFTQMFEQQAPFAPPIGSGDVKLKNYTQMLVVLNHVLTSAPEFNTTGMVGCPINAVLDFPMITRAGLAAFLSPKVNAMLKKVLKVWTEYLDSPASRYVLNSSENGWLCPAALKALHMEDFVHDPKAPYFGFRSWNDFFVRQLKPGVRPVAMRRVLAAYVEHFHAERNHPGKGNVLLFPSSDRAASNGSGRVRCQERLGGLRKYYHREAA